MATTSELDLRTVPLAAPISAGAPTRLAWQTALTHFAVLARWVIAPYRRWNARQERMMATAAERRDNVHLLFPRM